MRCCPNCFGDRGLRRSIFPLLTSDVGTCDYCQSTNSPLVNPPLLAEYFAPLINIYEPNPTGKPLIAWLKNDWFMLDHERMDDARSAELLTEVLENSELVTQNFIPSPRFEINRLDQWNELRDELMYKNRYFPDAHIDVARLEQLLEHLPADDVPTEWFRARIRDGDAAYPVAEMGAPPKRIASHGRANPPGIPYLYLASTPATAVSEIRPHTGEVACVADFSLPADIDIVDLRNPRKLVSPFLLGDETEIGLMRNDITFLERLGDELTIPILPQAAAIDYVPSQYLCEFIKKQEYDGVLYRSAVGDGVNLALFDPTRATVRGVQQWRVRRVSVDIAAVTQD